MVNVNSLFILAGFFSFKGMVNWRATISSAGWRKQESWSKMHALKAHTLQFTGRCQKQISGSAFRKQLCVKLILKMQYLLWMIGNASYRTFHQDGTFWVSYTAQVDTASSMFHLQSVHRRARILELTKRKWGCIQIMASTMFSLAFSKTPWQKNVVLYHSGAKCVWCRNPA